MNSLAVNDRQNTIA